MAAVSPKITACILARNEERRIEAALQSLQGWTDQILVIDNESEDRTVEIARRYTEQILTAPRAAMFDSLRNLPGTDQPGGLPAGDGSVCRGRGVRRF
jgi:glycosyltransferase involved in cell wall biosynthesis